MTTGCVIRYGEPVSAAREQEKGLARPYMLFGPDSTDTLSHVIEAVDHGFLIQAFQLQGDAVLTVQMVAGTGAADYAEDIIIDGQRIRVTPDNNVVFLPWPFRFRLQYSGSQMLGSFTVYAVPVHATFFEAVASSGRFA